MTLSKTGAAAQGGLRYGAVALIDVLGFRGIWKRHQAIEVLSMLEGMKRTIEERITRQFANQPHFQCDIAFLSDTVALSVELEPSHPDRDALSAIYLCDLTSWVLEYALRSPVPMAYRGAIAVGEYHIRPNFLIGPAIDEAASVHEQADGAIVWLTPGARAAVHGWVKANPRQLHLVRFDVPLKGRGTFNTFAVSPIEQSRDVDDECERASGTALIRGRERFKVIGGLSR